MIVNWDNDKNVYVKQCKACGYAYAEEFNKDGFISVERTRNQDWIHKVKFAKDIEIIGNIHDNPELLGE